jgi:hypothetical protein
MEESRQAEDKMVRRDTVMAACIDKLVLGQILPGSWREHVRREEAIGIVINRALGRVL